MSQKQIAYFVIHLSFTERVSSAGDQKCKESSNSHQLTITKLSSLINRLKDYEEHCSGFKAFSVKSVINIIICERKACRSLCGVLASCKKVSCIDHQVPPEWYRIYVKDKLWSRFD